MRIVLSNDNWQVEYYYANLLQLYSKTTAACGRAGVRVPTGRLI